MTRLSDFLAGRSPAEMYDTYWVPGMLDPFARDLAALASPRDHVLDVGCGTGLVTRYVAERVGADGRTVGLDHTPFMLNAGRVASVKHPQIEWSEARMEQIPFPDGTFDLVLSNQAWQYATDRTATFREIRRVLKSGGKLAGSVWSGPEPGTVHSVEEEAIGRHLGAEFLPIHAWTFGGLEVLRSLAEDAGFTIRSLTQETHDARFASIEELIRVVITSSGRTQPDGTMAVGMFDLDDASFEPKVTAMIADLEKQLAGYVTAAGFVYPVASDVLIATT